MQKRTKSTRPVNLRSGAIKTAALLAATLIYPTSTLALGTWSGATSNDMSISTNWDAIPGSGSGFIFTSATGAGGLLLNNTLTTGTGWTVTGITFNSGAAAFVIGDGTAVADSVNGKGNTFTLTNGVVNNSTNTQTINSAISLSGVLGISGSTGSGAIMLGGPISGSGTLNITSASTLASVLTLSGTNSFTGGINIGSNDANRATLNINSAGALGSGTLNIANGGIINNTSGSAVTVSSNNTVALGVSWTFGGSQDLTLGTGSITDNGFTANLNGIGRTLTFGGVLSNTNTGATVVGSGNKLVIGGLGLLTNTSTSQFSFLGDANVTITGAVTNGGVQTNNGFAWSDSGTVELRGANTFTGALQISTGGTVRITSTGSFSTANVLNLTSGGGTLIYDNTGASGSSAITLGAINLGSGSTGGSTTIQTNHVANANITLTLGAIARVGQGTSINFVTNGGTNDGTSNSIYLTNAAGAVGAVAGAYFYNGADYAWMSGANGYVRAPIYGTDTNTLATLTGAGASTWVKLTSSVTPIANVSIKALTLSGAVDYTQGAGTSLSVQTLLKSGGGSSTISGGTGIAWNNNQGTIRVDTANDKLTIATAITNTNGLTKVGAGTLFLTGSNVLTGGTRGFSINEGAVNAANGVGLPSGIVLSLVGGVFESNGTFSRALGTAVGNVQWITSGGFSAQGGNLAVNLGGSSAPLTWGTTGSFIANYRELTFGSVTADSMVDFQNAVSISTSSNVVRVLDNTNSTNDFAQMSGAITGVGTLIKAGAGTLEFTGANTYSGQTNVTAGQLNINNTHTGAGAYLVGSGGTLGGSGSITTASSANVVVAAGGSLSPGNHTTAIGTLTLALGTGQLDISSAVAATGTHAIQMDLTGAANDKISLTTGSLNIGTGLEFDDFALNADGTLAIASYTLIHSNNSIIGSLTGVESGTFGIYSGNIAISGDDLVLNVTAVPEPTSLSLLALGGTALLARRRRRSA